MDPDELIEEEWAEIMSQPPGRRCFPVKWQLMILGFTPEMFEGLKGKKALDVGCGAKASLVYHMREMGIEADGIDPFVEGRASFLFPYQVGAEYSIPRDNWHYDLVVAHSVGWFRAGLSTLRGKIRAEREAKGYDVERDMMIARQNGAYMLMESLRVLGPSGKFVCSPALDDLGDGVDKVLDEKGYCVSYESLPEEINIERRERLAEEGIEPVPCLEKRTIITRRF